MLQQSLLQAEVKESETYAKHSIDLDFEFVGTTTGFEK